MLLRDIFFHALTCTYCSRYLTIIYTCHVTSVMTIDNFVRVIKNVKNSLDAINLSNKSHKRELLTRDCYWVCHHT